MTATMTVKAEHDSHIAPAMTRGEAARVLAHLLDALPEGLPMCNSIIDRTYTDAGHEIKVYIGGDAEPNVELVAETVAQLDNGEVQRRDFPGFAYKFVIVGGFLGLPVELWTLVTHDNVVPGWVDITLPVNRAEIF